MRSPREPTPLRITHFITGLDVGGAERMLTRLCREWKKDSQVRHSVVALRSGGPLATQIRESGTECVEVGVNGLSSMHRLLLLPRIIARQKPQILQTWLYHADFLGVLMLPFLPRTTLIWNLRYSDIRMEHYSVASRFIRWANRILSRFTDAIIANSSRGEQLHQRLGYRTRNWEMIPNGFDLNHFERSPEKRHALRTQWKVGEADRLFGSLGRWDVMKDYGTFLRAAKILHDRDPQCPWKAVLGGRGLSAENPDLRNLLREINLPTERLILGGPQNDATAFYSALDFFTLTSIAEGSPNVIGEAMCCGLPVVSTDVGDVHAWLQESGIVVPVGDSAALARAWKAWIDDSTQDQLIERGQKGRKWTQDNLALPLIATRYNGFYRSMVLRKN